jgi:hypothetical protein
MHIPLAFVLPLCLAAAPPPAADETPRVELSDAGLPLWEVRPLERRVLVLTLDGDWKVKPRFDDVYYVKVLFPDGQCVSQRAYEEGPFRRGEIRCALVEYQLCANGLKAGDKLGVVVTRRRAGRPAEDAEVISNRVDVTWPLDRPVVRRPPRAKGSGPEPVDAFPPEDAPARPPAREPVPPPAPDK